MPAKIESFRIGCGRYLQRKNILCECAAELLKYGKRPLILAGKTAWEVAGKAVDKSLSAAGASYFLKIHKGSCNKEDAALAVALAKEEGCDLIVGVGGGVIMDFAKLVAVMADFPIVNIPTSSATCAAYTPLSVCYTPEGRTVGTVHHDKEVDAVLVDTELLLCQPPSLFLAGVFDAQAKFLEIKHRYRPESESYPLGLDYAYVLAVRSYEELSAKTAAALGAMENGECTEAFEQVIFTAIAVTGVISGIARGSNQTALAHKFYEITRALYPAESKPYLHGELVGVGLLLQNEYNGECEKNAELLAFMQKYGMPCSPAASGVPEESLSLYYEKIMKSSAMADAAPEAGKKLRTALEHLWKKQFINLIQSPMATEGSSL